MRRSFRTKGQRAGAAASQSRQVRAAAASAWRRQPPRGPQRMFSSTELKFADTLLNDADLDDDGQISLLNGLTTGTSAVQRIGRKIVIRSIEVHGQFRAAPAAVVPVGIKLMIILDKQANGVAPTLDMILERSGDSYSPVSPRNLANRDRFQCLKQYTTTLGASYGGAGIGQDYSRRFDIYLRTNIPVIYNDGTTATVADISSNALYLVACSGIATGNASVPQIIFYARIRFSD